MKKCNKCGIEFQEDDFNCCPYCRSELLPVENISTVPNVIVGDGGAVNQDIDITKDDHSTDNSNNTTNSNNITTNNTTTQNFYVPFPPLSNPTSVPPYSVPPKTQDEMLLERKNKYFDCCKKVTQDGSIITSEKRNWLEEQRIKLDISAEIASSILREAINSNKRGVMSMGIPQRILFNNIKRAVEGNMLDNVKRYLPQIKVIAKKYHEEELQYLYHMVLAAINPEKCIKDYQNRQEDRYWQTFWTYVAYHKIGDVQEAENVMIEMDEWNGLMPEENCVVLAALGSLMEQSKDIAENYLQELKDDYSSLLSPIVEVSLSIINYDPNDSDIAASLKKNKFYVDSFFGQIFQTEVETIRRAVEEKKQQAEEERRRKQEEIKRKQEEEERQRKLQEEEKIRRKAEEEQRKKEEETRRLLEEERKRIEEEKKRLEAERQAAEEAKRKEKEERERKQKEEEERRKKEEETRRLLEEERKRIEEEKKRLEAERQAAEEAKRKEKEESERKKKEEEQRKKAEEEQKKKEEEEARLLEKKRRLIEEQRKKDEERLRAKNANRQSALLKIIDSNFIVNGSKARSFVSYDDVLQICGRGATSSGDNCSVLNIDDDNILSPHLIIKYDYKNNCYLIAVIGETCLNGRKLSKDPSKWLKLPNNSFLMLNGEIEMDFNIINPQQDNNDKPELSTIEDESYIDLGLPSGTKWKPTNETNPNSNDGYDFFSYDEAVAAFGEKLPTKIQWEELMDNCTWSWDSNKKGYTVVGPNGNNIFLPAAGSCVDYTESLHIGKIGVYWSSTPNGPDYIWYIHFDFLVEKKIYIADGGWRAFRYSVRLVKI